MENELAGDRSADDSAREKLPFAQLPDLSVLDGRATVIEYVYRGSALALERRQ